MHIKIRHTSLQRLTFLGNGFLWGGRQVHDSSHDLEGTGKIDNSMGGVGQCNNRSVFISVNMQF